MELLKIASNGQWSLVKASEFASSPGNNYMSYRKRTLTGELPDDKGTKGMLHNSSNTRAPRKTSKERMKGKVPTPTSSSHDDNDPGVGA
jgi:hypothetical protein